MRTTFLWNGRRVGTGHIDPLPGSSQVAVFHSAFVLPEFRKQGAGEEAHKQRIELATGMLYDYALVTVDSSNEVQLKILERNHWKKLDGFHSSKTGHLVFIYGRRLIKE